MVGFAGHEDLFIGQDPLALERHYRVLAHIDFHYGRCWPLDLALWDLAGKIAGQPCWKLLGGLSNRVQAYASCGVLRDAGALLKELVDVKLVMSHGGRVRMGADGHGEHDDLVVALALACWKAKRKPVGFGPRRLPGI